MARNEEKQQGRLNRLWLQKEREEGRIKDVHERRPKLSTLNSASAVKKWIPSIKNEIEYYLQQSQLSHYPDRKIAEFQLCIEGLETEYKRFLCKLRALDPSCKHRPWTPRAYTKRRADPPDSASHTEKRRAASCDLSGLLTEAQQSERTSGGGTSACERQESARRSESRHVPAPDLAHHSPAGQDLPLAFDRTRLAVALSGSRGPIQPGSPRTHSLARVLLAGLPNLHSSPLGQALAAQARDATSTWGTRTEEEGTLAGRQAAGQGLGVEGESISAGDERAGTAPRSPGDTQEAAAHILGLGCYSSSDDESDA